MPRTHPQLNKAFREIGRQLGIRLASTYWSEDTRWVDSVRSLMAPHAPQHSDNRLQQVIRNVLQGQLGRFASNYRDVQTGTDENVSTSSVRELLIGITQGLHDAGVGASSPRLPAICHALAPMIEGLSRIRLATRFTGFHDLLTGELMQHATSPGTGLFGANVRGDGSASRHDELDRSRREYVLKAMQVAFNASSSVSAPLLAAAAAGLEFTINAMVAPAQAANQALMAHVDASLASLQTMCRELMKQVAAALGVRQMPGVQPLTAPWTSLAMLGQLTPRRVAPQNPFATAVRPQPSSAPLTAAELARIQQANQDLDDTPWAAVGEPQEPSAFEWEPAPEWRLFLEEFDTYVQTVAGQDWQAIDEDPGWLWQLLNENFDGYLARETFADAPFAQPAFDYAASAPPEDPMDDAMGDAMDVVQMTDDDADMWSDASSEPPADEEDPLLAEEQAGAAPVMYGPDANASDDAELADDDASFNGMMAQLDDVIPGPYLPGAPAAFQQSAGDASDSEELLDAMFG